MDYGEIENNNFKSMLQLYLAKVGYKFLQGLSVLDVACGKCREAEVLFEVFGLNVIGIDYDNEKIEDLKNRLGSNKGRFETANAEKLDKVLDKEMDIVIARHPNIGGDNWAKIYRQACEATKPEGVIISTFYTNLDHHLGVPLIYRAGYDIEVSEENPHTLSYSDSSLIKSGADRFLTIGKKRLKNQGALKLFFRKFSSQGRKTSPFLNL